MLCDEVFKSDLGLVHPQKVKHKMTTKPSNSTAKYLLRELKAGAQADTYIRMLTTAFFTITKKMATNQCPSQRNVHQQWYGLQMEYYSS